MGLSATGVLLFSLLCLLCLLSLTPTSDAEADADKVNVSVFFETLCPDSRTFILHQLYPVWRDLQDILGVHLHAYGKAKELEHHQFHCQHGQRECKGNMMVSCALEVTPDSSVHVEFTRCVMKEYRGAEAGLLCANETGVEYTEVEKCMESGEGASLQEALNTKQAMLNPKLTYVPWILINNVFTPTLLKKAQQDLRGVVCEEYKGPRPEGCM